jgi:SulP family sulfate permease
MLAPTNQDPPAGRFSRLIRWNYTQAELRADLIAGLTVAAISLPQGMAYALLAGVDPRFGLYSAIVVTAVASIFGSSSLLINGPTSAISLVVFSALAFLDPDDKTDIAEALVLLGVMVGTIQIFIAVFKLGDLTRYISESVILGFMLGASLLLGVGQIANLLGVRQLGTGHQDIWTRLWLTLTKGDPLNPRAIAISVATIVLALLLRRLVRAYRLPQLDMLAALVIVSGTAFLLGWTLPGLDGKRLVEIAGTVPASLPEPHIPEIEFGWIGQLSSSALAIAFLGLLEALAIAKSIAHTTRQPLDYNRQCLAEGLANLAGGFFRCLPGSGSLSRSAINFQAGALTRFSGIVVAVAVALAVLLFAPLTRFIPKAALAGLLVLTASRLIDITRLRYAFAATKFDAGLVIITALVAVFVGVEYSILAGVLLSMALFIPRASKLKSRELVVSPERVVRERLPSDPPNPDLILIDLEGELFFGAAPELERALDDVLKRATAQRTRYVVLRVKRVRNPDMVCLERIDHFLHEAEKHGVTVLLAGVRPDFLAAIKNLHFLDRYPADLVYVEEDEDYSATLKAVRRVYELLAAAKAGEGSAETDADQSHQEKLYYLV